MLIAEEVEPTNGEVKDFPTLDELDKMREKRMAENLENCSKELTALLDKYKVKIAWRTVIDDGKVTENVLIIQPK